MQHARIKTDDDDDDDFADDDVVSDGEGDDVVEPGYVMAYRHVPLLSVELLQPS